ncbi:PadR family transcriptional regulator [Paenibacillus anaericanus]|uniref:PadR family transcriptional regulator n=1 Tax=Paenibacillus anaericanus TaxID=170367 RepID=A0A433Y739_9BACL|nr:PadR family transcriptional regulator [Paenibacillus anaericanus]RUT45191.1 PadR family transcriptional regulator [Paenibacillus anaericanus]
MLENVILGLLLEQPMSGYDIKKTIDSSFGFFLKASYGSLYPALKRLTEKSYVSVMETENSKNKKIYTLLPSGKETFLTWLAEPIETPRNELLGRIFFYDHLDEATREQRLSEYLYRLEQEIKGLGTVQQIVSQELASLPNPGDYYYRVSVLFNGISQLTLVKEWIQNIKERNDLHVPNSK